MNLKLYYRDYFAGNLHCVAVEGAESVGDAISALKEDLTASKEFWLKPILALIQGGES